MTNEMPAIIPYETYASKGEGSIQGLVAKGGGSLSFPARF